LRVASPHAGYHLAPNPPTLTTRWMPHAPSPSMRPSANTCPACRMGRCSPHTLACGPRRAGAWVVCASCLCRCCRLHSLGTQSIGSIRSCLKLETYRAVLGVLSCAGGWARPCARRLRPARPEPARRARPAAPVWHREPRLDSQLGHCAVDIDTPVEPLMNSRSCDAQGLASPPPLDVYLGLCSFILQSRATGEESVIE
jgi:hypothetical protein